VWNAPNEVADLDASINEKADISFLVDRLATRFGSHRILAFQPNDTHIPEAAWLAVPAQYAQPAKLPWKKIRSIGDAPRRPLRLFTRPEPVTLLTTMSGSQHLRWRRAQHVVAQCEGPDALRWNGGAMRRRSRRAIISAWRMAKAGVIGFIAPA
jgi:protein ImuB